MADKDTEGVPIQNLTPETVQSFANLLGNAVADGLAKNNPKKVSFGEYTRRTNLGRPKLTRGVFHNGFFLQETSLSIDEINLLNQVNRTGRYIDRLVEVIVRAEGADEVVEIRHNCKTADQRMELQNHVRSFKELLSEVVAAQKLENEEEEQWKQARKPAHTGPTFGNSKATREARERVGV